MDSYSKFQSLRARLCGMSRLAHLHPHSPALTQNGNIMTVASHVEEVSSSGREKFCRAPIVMRQRHNCEIVMNNAVRAPCSATVDGLRGELGQIVALPVLLKMVRETRKEQGKLQQRHLVVELLVIQLMQQNPSPAVRSVLVRTKPGVKSWSGLSLMFMSFIVDS